MAAADRWEQPHTDPSPEATRHAHAPREPVGTRSRLDITPGVAFGIVVSVVTLLSVLSFVATRPSSTRYDEASTPAATQVSISSNDRSTGPTDIAPPAVDPVSHKPCAPARSAIPNLYETTTVHNGSERSFHVSIPMGYDENRLHPVIVSFHANGRTVKANLAATGFDRPTDEFIVVSPQAIGTTAAWNGSADLGIDDVGFFDQLMVQLDRSLCIDPNRVFVAGIDGGAAMAMRLACEADTAVAGVVVVLGSETMPVCDRSEPLPFLAFGDFGSDGSAVAGEVDRLAQHNSCAEVGTDPMGPRIEQITWQECDVLSMALDIADLDARWPGRKAGFETDRASLFDADAVSGTSGEAGELQATDLALEFFGQIA